MDECKGCGKCCQKHWLLKLTNKHEKKLFKDSIVYGEFIWTDECKFLKEGNCLIHDERQPYKCKQYFCEGREL